MFWYQKDLGELASYLLGYSLDEQGPWVGILMENDDPMITKGG